MNTGKVILSVLTGVAVGAALGILFAPDKGSTTRKKIYKRSNAYVDDVEEKFNDYIESVKKEYQTLREEAVNMAEHEKVKEAEAEG